MRSASGLQILSLVSCALDYKFLFCYTSLIVASCIGYFGFFAALFYPVRRPFYNGLFIPFNVFLCNWWVNLRLPSSSLFKSITAWPVVPEPEKESKITESLPLAVRIQ